MRPISDALAAILKDHYQAGADGFRARLETGGPGPPEYMGHGPDSVGTGSPLSVTLPTGQQAGWLLIMQLTSMANVGWAVPTGWTEIGFNYTPDVGGNRNQHLVARRSVGAADDALIVDVDNSGAIGPKSGMVHMIRGVSGNLGGEGDTWESVGGEYDTSAIVQDRIVEAGAGPPRLAMNFYVVDGNEGTSVFTGETGGTWFQVAADSDSGATLHSMGAQVAVLAGGATIDGGSFSHATSQAYNVMGLALVGSTTGFVHSYRLIRASFDKSLDTDADQFEVEIDNSDGAIALDDVKPNMPVQVYAWYGNDSANEVLTFSGLVDRVRPSRHPNVITITGRDWMKKLIVQKLAVTAPQSADDPAAVRTPSNYVYLDFEVSNIVEDLLNNAFFPSDRWHLVPTGVNVVEFLGSDQETFAAAISRLCDLVGYVQYCDEDGDYWFTPNDVTGSEDPDYTYQTGVDVLQIQLESDDDQAYTRVRVSGPMTVVSTVDAWEEVWQTAVIAHPVGVWYDPLDSANLRVLDSRTKRIYTLRQSDQVILSSVYIGGSVTYPIGLSGDPTDSDAYWVLNVPCWDTGGPVAGVQSGNAMHKFRRSDNVHLASFPLPNGPWSDMKVSASGFTWLTNYLDHKLWKFDGSDPVQGYQLSNPATDAPLRNPTGIAVDGTTLLTFFAEGHAYASDESDPYTITRTILSAPGMYGGDFDTDTHIDIYVVSSGLHRVWKYTAATTSETSLDVVAEAVNEDFETELEALSGTPEIRRLVVPMEAILSQVDAMVTAETMLARVSKFSNTIDVGIIGNPALQKTDKVRVVDPVLGVANDYQVGTYRSELAGDSGTYLGSLSMRPWNEIPL